MFPLEQTILPTALVPLHIFESRYRELARVVTGRAEPEFGIAMIERGREVGGHDERASVGVVARVVEHDELPDGRWGLIAAATRRIRIQEWLADDPFPRAQVADWPDEDATTYRAADAAAEIEFLGRAVERMRVAAQRLDPNRAPTPEPAGLSTDPAQATWQAAVAAQLGPLDAMALLQEPTAAGRTAVASRLIEGRAEMLEALADQGG